jgi:hypothetical protein
MEVFLFNIWLVICWTGPQKSTWLVQFQGKNNNNWKNIINALYVADNSYIPGSRYNSGLNYYI